MPQARDKRAGDATAEQPRAKKPAAGASKAPLTLAAEMEQLAAVAAGVQQRMSMMGAKRATSQPQRTWC